MELKRLKDIPPWDWPEGVGSVLLAALRNDTATESDQLLAAELAGDVIVMNDEMALALVSLLENGDRSEKVRARAAISLGPVL